MRSSNSQMEDADWSSVAALCPFCGACLCSGNCMRSPGGSGDAVRGSTPQLTQAVLDLDDLLDRDDEDEDDSDNLLYTISQSFIRADGEATREELEAATRQLEAIMMHHMYTSRDSTDGADSIRSGVDPSDSPNSSQRSCLMQQHGDFVLRLSEETDAAAKPAEASGAFAQLSNHYNPAVAMVRSRVSQAKRRYQKDGFDLDLTYITPRIIAMGFPAWGTEKYYRNPIDQVELFFDSKHPGHYRIYNLCSERPEYDSANRFHGNYKRFPFDDHNAPCPITLIAEFVQDAMIFLEEDAKNVVAIHCKAGKGRTGLMTSCLLRAVDPLRITNAEEALRFFGEARTHNGLGVTIPSQMRYVHYYDRAVKEFDGKFPPSRPLKLYQITIDSAIKTSGQVEVYFTIEERGTEKIDSRRLFPRGPTKDSKGRLFLFENEPELEGDLRFVFYQRKRLVDEELFYFWLSTSLCSAHEHLSYASRDLDGRPTKSKETDTFCKDLAVHVVFIDHTDDKGTERKLDANEKKRNTACEENHSVSNGSISYLPKGLQRFLPKLLPSS